MDPVALGQLRPQTLVSGRNVVTNASPTQAPVTPKVETVATTPLPATPSSTFSGGIETRQNPDGTTLQKAASGMSVSTETDGSKHVQLRSGESFRWTSEGVTTSDHGIEPKLSKTEDGLTLLSFQDKDDNTVQVQPDSLTYEVLNKQKNLAQVYHPDGFQEIVAFGKFRESDGTISDYQHHLVLDPQGQMVDSSGFEGMALDGRKLSFDLGNGARTERTLARPLPGQEAFEAPTKPTLEVPTNSDGPLAILEDPTVASVSEEKATVAQAPTSPFSELTDIRKDFFAGADQPGVSFDQTTSGLVMRHEGETRSFLLPNGDSFRTNGRDVEVLGETPRAENAQIVEHGDGQLLAYSDSDGNHHSLDISSGDYEVSNPEGSLTQGFRADGTLEYGVRGSLTNEVGEPETYHHQASFAQNGSLISKQGFDDLRIQDGVMSFTLPDGTEVDRTLLQATEHSVNIPKKLVLSEGMAQEWGGGLNLADQLLGLSPTPPVAVPPAAEPIAAPKVPGELVAPAGPGWRPGQTRVGFPDGTGTVSTLPNGYKIVSGAEPYAIDATGQRVPLERGQMALESGEISQLLSLRTPEGVGYTIFSHNMDTMVSSADGKVTQMVSPHGKVLTSVMDGGSKVLYEFDPMSGTAGTPGTGFDPRFPDRLIVQGAPGGSYQLPHSMLAPNGQTANAPYQSFGASSSEGAAPHSGYLAGAGGTAEGVRPSFWERFKAAFTNENPWDPAMAAQRQQDQQQMFQGPMNSTPYPAGYHQVGHPMSDQLASMQRQNNLMMAGMTAMTALPMLNMMFFSPFGAF